ncbi:MAG: integration host factor subunit alpha [Thermodesulfobacteriota bacterium]
MTKKELADVIHTKIGLSKRESAEIVEFFFDIAKDRLSKGEGIKLPRFGSFRVQNRKARKGRNPATGETIEIAERKAVVFKPSRFLRDSIDKHTD